MKFYFKSLILQLLIFSILVSFSLNEKSNHRIRHSSRYNLSPADLFENFFMSKVLKPSPIQKQTEQKHDSQTIKKQDQNLKIKQAEKDYKQKLQTHLEQKQKQNQYLLNTQQQQRQQQQQLQQQQQPFHQVSQHIEGGEIQNNKKQSREKQDSISGQILKKNDDLSDLIKRQSTLRFQKIEGQNKNQQQQQAKMVQKNQNKKQAEQVLQQQQYQNRKQTEQVHYQQNKKQKQQAHQYQQQQKINKNLEQQQKEQLLNQKQAFLKKQFQVEKKQQFVEENKRQSGKIIFQKTQKQVNQKVNQNKKVQKIELESPFQNAEKSFQNLHPMIQEDKFDSVTIVKNKFAPKNKFHDNYHFDSVKYIQPKQQVEYQLPEIKKDKQNEHQNLSPNQNIQVYNKLSADNTPHSSIINHSQIKFQQIQQTSRSRDDTNITSNQTNIVPLPLSNSSQQQSISQSNSSQVDLPQQQIQQSSIQKQQISEQKVNSSQGQQQEVEKILNNSQQAYITPQYKSSQSQPQNLDTVVIKSPQQDNHQGHLSQQLHQYEKVTYYNKDSSLQAQQNKQQFDGFQNVQSSQHQSVQTQGQDNQLGHAQIYQQKQKEYYYDPTKPLMHHPVQSQLTIAQSANGLQQLYTSNFGHVALNNYDNEMEIVPVGGKSGAYVHNHQADVDHKQLHKDHVQSQKISTTISHNHAQIQIAFNIIKEMGKHLYSKENIQIFVKKLHRLQLAISDHNQDISDSIMKNYQFLEHIYSELIETKETLIQLDLNDVEVEKIDQKINDISSAKHQLQTVKRILILLQASQFRAEKDVINYFPPFMVKYCGLNTVYYYDALEINKLEQPEIIIKKMLQLNQEMSNHNLEILTQDPELQAFARLDQEETSTQKLMKQLFNNEIFDDQAKLDEIESNEQGLVAINSKEAQKIMNIKQNMINYIQKLDEKQQKQDQSQQQVLPQQQKLEQSQKISVAPVAQFNEQKQINAQNNKNLLNQDEFEQLSKILEFEDEKDIQVQKVSNQTNSTHNNNISNNSNSTNESNNISQHLHRLQQNINGLDSKVSKLISAVTQSQSSQKQSKFRNQAKKSGKSTQKKQESSSKNGGSTQQTQQNQKNKQQSKLDKKIQIQREHQLLLKKIQKLRQLKNMAEKINQQIDKDNKQSEF